MALPLLPQLTAQRWGREGHQVFDYLANPSRDPAGNPLIIFRHIGGGTGGDYQDVWGTNREPANFFQYLNTTSTLTNKFDILSIQTAQRSIDNPANTPSQTYSPLKTWIMQSVFELQQGISAVKQLGVAGFGPSNQYKIDPRKVFLFGSSHGAGMCSLSQLLPPFIGGGGQQTSWFGKYASMNYTSRCAGVVFHDGQIDIRNISGTDQIHYKSLGGWFGSSVDTSTEWNAIPNTLKASASVLAYIQNGDTSFYVPHYTMWPLGGDHIHPYGDPSIGASSVHDSQQLTTLNTALTTANLSFGTTPVYSGTTWLDTGAASMAEFTKLYTWLSGLISGTNAQTPLPVL